MQAFFVDFGNFFLYLTFHKEREGWAPHSGSVFVDDVDIVDMVDGLQ